MNKKVTIGITLAFIFIAIAITFTATMIYSMNLFDQKIVSIQERESMYEKISEVDAIVRQNYYREIDDEEIMNALARGYIAGTGDDSIKYFSSADITRIEETKTGKVCGIGVETEVNANGYVQIKEVHSGTSAEKVGIHVGDTIVKVDSKDALSLGADQVISSLFGTDGEEVTLTYSREGVDYTFSFVYGIYESRSIQAYDVEGYTYFRIMEFNDLTMSQFEDLLSQKMAEGTTKGFIYDLRDTDGGYDINIVANMLDKIVGQCTLISGTYRDGMTKVLFTSGPDEIAMPTAVLVNGNTVGYSELFAAVLGERDNVRIIGETTAGVGTHRVLSRFPDGTGLYMPVCELLACGTASFNESGVTPDFVTSSYEGFVITDEEPSIIDDLQLRKAVEVLDSEFSAGE